MSYDGCIGCAQLRARVAELEEDLKAAAEAQRQRVEWLAVLRAVAEAAEELFSRDWVDAPSGRSLYVLLEEKVTNALTAAKEAGAL